MPAFDTVFVRTPVKTTFSVALEPVRNVLMSQMLVLKADMYSGLNEWVTRTAATLTPEGKRVGKLVLAGMYYAVRPTRSWSSFPAYLDYLAAEDPLVLRDRVLAAYDRHCDLDVSEEGMGALSNPDKVLASLDAFLAYLRTGYPEESIDVDMEKEAYALLVDPPALRERVVSHLRSLWKERMAAEWERNLPMLQTCVEAFQQLDFSDATLPEAARMVMGQPMPEVWQGKLEKAEIERVIFVPSAHLGPYRSMDFADGTLWLHFGARLPAGTQITSPDLSRSELLVRLSALADETRLQILQALKEEDELCSKDIMERLDLSQSAASRHLKQLSATGYLEERRKNGAKCYCLSEEKVEDTIQALSRFLLG